MSIKIPEKKIVMQINSATKKIDFIEKDNLFETKTAPQILQIDTSQLHKKFPDSSIVELVIDKQYQHHILATFVADGTSNGTQQVFFNVRLQGRIDTILILLNMPTNAGEKTGPFPFFLRIGGTGSRTVPSDLYDPQVGNDPPIT
jgi:hypothetical protein